MAVGYYSSVGSCNCQNQIDFSKENTYKMDPTERLELLRVSKISRKLEKLLECKDEFEPLILTEVEKLGAKKEFESPQKEDSLESEMVVCVRVRPR